MDETAEIRERLGRIAALTDARAPAKRLLPEVRALLQEGERTLADGLRVHEGDEADADAWSRSRELVQARAGSPSGEEAAVP